MPTVPLASLCEEARKLLDGAPHRFLAGGERVESTKSHTFKTIDSLTGEPTCEIPHVGINIVWTNRR